jgi:hypothetical protein
MLYEKSISIIHKLNLIDPFFKDYIHHQFPAKKSNDLSFSILHKKEASSIKLEKVFPFLFIFSINNRVE